MIMTVNTVRNLDRTGLEVPAGNSRDSSGVLLLIMGRRSKYSQRGLISNGIKRRKSVPATILVEAMVATVILSIATLGALSYQYYAARHARIAQAQITAMCTAQLLLEDWKSTSGSQEYDPTTLGLGFSSLMIPSYFSEGKGKGVGTPLNNTAYTITVDNVLMWLILRWKDVDNDPIAGITLRELAISIKWWEGSDVPPIILTTYVRLDESDG
jgi:type II secretory pathway pseudopilin PulG